MLSPHRLVSALTVALSLGCSTTVIGLGDGATDAPVDAAADAPPRDVATMRAPRLHRADASACSASPGPGRCSLPPMSGPPGACHADAECSTGRNGRCIGGFGGPAYCFCSYDACTLDADCHTGGPCACHGAPYSVDQGNTCVPGNCQSDANCGPGGYCSPSRGANNCGTLSGYYCHTAGDLCVDDADCPDGGGMRSICNWQESARRWECVSLLLCV